MNIITWNFKIVNLLSSYHSHFRESEEDFPALDQIVLTDKQEYRFQLKKDIIHSFCRPKKKKKKREREREPHQKNKKENMKYKEKADKTNLQKQIRLSHVSKAYNQNQQVKGFY
jgi:hypothetical protein